MPPAALHPVHGRDCQTEGATIIGCAASCHRAASSCLSCRCASCDFCTHLPAAPPPPGLPPQLPPPLPPNPPTPLLPPPLPPRAPPPPPDVFFSISTRVCALGGHVVRAAAAPGSFALRFILDHWLSGAMLHVELRGAALTVTKVDEFGSTEPAKTSDVDAEDDEGNGVATLAPKLVAVLRSIRQGDEGMTF